jgi:uncharacterized protein YciI
MLFAITCLDKPGALEVRKANRAAHLDYIRPYSDGAVSIGPLLAEDGETMIGSLLLLDLPDRAAAEALAANDPYAKAGLFQSVTIHAYKKVLP